MSATNARTRVRGAYLIDGVRLERELRTAPLTARPIPIERGFVGRDGRELFNTELTDLGFVTVIDRPIWGTQFGPRHRLALVITDEIEVDNMPTCVLSVDATVGQLADLLALSHGGAPRVFAGVLEVSHDRGGRWQPLAVQAGSGPWPGSLLEKLAVPGEPVGPLDVAGLLPGLHSDARVPLWLSMHRGIAGELRWDARVFRLTALLETIAKELIPSGVTVVGWEGDVLLDLEGKPATTKQLRGAIYGLLLRSLRSLSLKDQSLRAHPSRTLWEEVGVWVDIRSAVAHEGIWRPPPSPSRKAAAQRRVAEAFELAGRGDGLEGGWMRYAEACGAATEAVLRAAVLSPRGPGQ